MRAGGEPSNTPPRRLHPDEFPVGRISELVPEGSASGLSLLFAALLGDPSEPCTHPEWVLVDGADGFDPDSFTGAACSKMLWVRCSSVLEMLRSADLLVQDGNVQLIIMDATGLPRRELGALPHSAWWRLNHAVERTGARLVVMSPYPLVPCASLRLSLSAGLSLGDFDESRGNLVNRLQAAPSRLRHAT